MVYLIPHSSAPLASRISQPPLSKDAPTDLEPPSLAEMSMQTQETALIDDLLYVFMGYEGQYVRFGESYTPWTRKIAWLDLRFTHSLDLTRA